MGKNAKELDIADRALIVAAGRFARTEIEAVLEGRRLLSFASSDFTVPAAPGITPQVEEMVAGPNGNIWFTAIQSDADLNNLPGAD